MGASRAVRAQEKGDATEGDSKSLWQYLLGNSRHLCKGVESSEQYHTKKNFAHQQISNTNTLY